jgi:carboxyl-terminal processing protease
MKSIIVVAVAFAAIALAHADESVSQQADYAEVAAAINETMRTYHYDPAELDTPGYQRIEAAITDLAEVATSNAAFVEDFSEIWKSGPFSHVELRAAQQSADDIAAYLDNLRVGGGGAVLTWQGDVAILTVNTMMGLDTIEEIDAAYVAIANRGADGLVIDLRENGGGAFAVRPLVAHLLNETVDGGSFVSQRWNAKHNRAPNLSELTAVAPWDGWSIRAFWADVQDAAITRFSISPVEPFFAGPVYVLTSERTASAAELATDVLQSSGRAVVIGENTAGQMLSQKIFDVPGGFHLSLPVADYYSIKNGRIEGVGVKPDVEADAADALNVAFQLMQDRHFP